MKDKKYTDIKGLESLDTPRQLDQFEAVGSKSLPIRNVFDFSLGLNNLGRGVGGSLIPLFDNLIFGDDDWDVYKGVPGHAHLMLANKPVWANGYPNLGQYSDETIPQEYFITSKVADINNVSEVPYWDENALIYLDESQGSIYFDSGVSNNPNSVREFRSGHIELTFKTNKQNSIIGVGTVKKTNYSVSSGKGFTGGSEAENSRSFLLNDSVSVIDSKNAYIADGFSNSHTLYINIKNGKINIEYFDDFGPNKQEFSILGNLNIADDKWHHVVINFGKPGVVRNQDNKFNERFIEIWVDGQLDKRTKEYVNESQIYFPTIDWLLMDPTLIEDERTIDSFYSVGGNLENFNSTNIINRDFENAKTTAFKGSIHHYSSGINNPLSKNEIQRRYALYAEYRNSVNAYNVTAEMVSPAVFGNKKKALKLFWNKLVNENTKNGIALDDNFDVYTYSITHKIKNSNSEIYNIDNTNLKTIKYLPDVKVALKDNILIFGPGKESLYNRREVWDAQIGEQIQLTPNLGLYDGLNDIDLNFDPAVNSRFSSYSIQNLLFSGISLTSGDRVLLTNQINKKENGIYTFTAIDQPLVREENLRSPSQINNAVVRITDGYYKDTSWTLTNTIDSLNDVQEWVELEFHPKENDINAQPIFTQRWTEVNGEERFIDLQQDLNINNYDLIVFMNYPETNEEVKESFVGYNDFEIKVKYDNFIKSLRNACAQGASLYVSSPKLAQDLGIVKTYKLIDQMLETSDAQSAAISPFEAGEPADQYFDTHRINQYQLQTEVAGLTNKETYILTDFINYVPSNINEPQQYHAKYAYRQLGLKEGNQFFIPSLSLLKIAENEKLPGFAANRKGTNQLPVVEPNQINAGTIVTKLQNTYYQNGQIVNNLSDDDATTIVVHNGQVLNGQPITGKIFVNFIEDGYTMSRREYNKARIQVVPENDTNETTATRAWQYSTTRLNRLPQRINIRELTEYGQTTPTNGGGGPLIQAPTNSSNGIIRSLTDAGNLDYQSDLYPTEAEEIYPTQEIPVLSMTYLGLQWLAE
jgi:hypothetical protein